ncbi:MAG: formyltransferase family protein, partial [Gammaproteobacteria bacterium]|nr:formyltransferase family protein [Gammaproteobacteria bacterium]
MSTDLVSPIRLVVLISGNGSNLQAIIDNITNNKLPARIVAVISNK